jgi:hypothetical protein
VGRIAPTLVTVTRSTCSACGLNEDRVLNLINEVVVDADEDDDDNKNEINRLKL